MMHALTHAINRTYAADACVATHTHTGDGDLGRQRLHQAAQCIKQQRVHALIHQGLLQIAKMTGADGAVSVLVGDEAQCSAKEDAKGLDLLFLTSAQS
jgi:hypothetical protein